MSQPAYKSNVLKNLLKAASNSGQNNKSWKGDSVSCSGMHTRIRTKYGTPQKCEECGTTDKKWYDWANISGEYKYERDDWKRLCRPCHRKMDNVCKPVQQLDKNGLLLREFSSIKEAAIFLGKKNGSSIGKCCNGIIKHNTAYGYKWKYQ